MQNEKLDRKSYFDHVFANTIKSYKPSKRIRRWRYVNTNIKNKDLLSSVFNIC